MLSWQLWKDTPEEWDSLLQTFSDFTIYQSHAWGEHRAGFGWQSIKLFIEDGNEIIAMAQVLLKRYPFRIGIVWVPGGPIGKVDTWDKNFQQVIRSLAGITFLYCRINPSLPYSTEDASKMIAWKKTSYPINSGLSLVYDPSLDEESRLKQCSSNWRHNLRRSAKRNTNTYRWETPNAEEMIIAYAKMQDYKDIKQQTSSAQIKSILSIFEKNCIMVRCDDGDGNLLAFRGALVLGEKGWDIFAATIPAGRSEYASHAAFWELTKQCAAQNITWYDMGGVDPIKSRGVYDFKKGTGARDLEYLGEWEYARPSLFAKIANKAITIKGI